MNNYYTITPQGDTCLNLNQVAQEFCLPKREICFPKNIEGLLTDCGLEWNCIDKCPTDEVFNMPVLEDDCFCIETQFFDIQNADRTCPTENWVKVFVKERCCEDEIQIDASYFKCIGLGWSGRYSFQVWCIDFSKFTDFKCFQLIFRSGDQECASQHYDFVPNCNECEYVTIESTYKKYDCFNNYYGDVKTVIGEGGCKFSNRVRIPFSICYYGMEVSERNFVNTSLTNTLNRDYYRLLPCTKIAPYLIRYLRMIFSGDEIKIDGQVYQIDSLPRISPSTKSRKMYSPEIEVYKQCKTDNNC